nr:guanylate-binding protein 1-like [Chelonoidis abingdonii]
MEHSKVKPAGGGGWQEGEDSAEFVRFFPAFMWGIRDFTLQLELDGREITEDEYLENALKLKTDSSQRTQRYNLPRECIRPFFPARKCFVFVPPARGRDLSQLEELQVELEPRFWEHVTQFCRHIWETSQPKTIPGGHVVTRAKLGNLAVTYVDTIRSGAVPCLESAVLALAQIKNSAAVGEAVAAYEEQLGRWVVLPTESVQELLELHAQCEQEALWAFMAHAFKDDDCRFQGSSWQCRLEKQKQELCRRNELASSDHCTATLLELWDELDNRIGQGVYSVPGSYQRFLDDRQHMVEKYWQVPGKGVKADMVLQEFRQCKEVAVQSILQMDEALTEKEEAVAAQRAQAEAAEQEWQVRQQQEAELQQKLKAQERSYQENLQQLEEKLQDKRKKLLEEQHKMLDQKLQELKELKREGLREKAGCMENEIQRLQQQIKEIRNRSRIEPALVKLIEVALPHVTRLHQPGHRGCHQLCPEPVPMEPPATHSHLYPSPLFMCGTPL